MTQSSAARPGIFSRSLDSSFTVRLVSQPQKAKMDPDSPRMKACRVRPDGENHEKLNSSASGELDDCTIAAMAKINSTISWKVTSTICSFSVASIPR